MPRIDGERLLADLRRIADFGRYQTGVHRPHLSPQDIESRHWLAGRMREAGLASNLNTCHVWHEDGAHVARVREGTMFELPLSVKRRHQKLGRAVD